MTHQLGDRDHRLRTHGDHESYIVQELQEPSPLLFDSEERKVLFSGVRSPILVADTPEEDTNNTNATELKECRALIGELQEPSPLLFDSEERTTAWRLHNPAKCNIYTLHAVFRREESDSCSGHSRRGHK